MRPQLVAVDDDRVAPHSLDAERAVLGAVLVQPELWGIARAAIGGREFFRDAHRQIFACMDVLSERGDAIDFITLKDELTRTGQLDDVGGPAYLAALTDGMPRSANVEFYARIVKDYAARRALIHAANTIRAAAHDGAREVAQVAAEVQTMLARTATIAAVAVTASSLPDLLARVTGMRNSLLGDLIALGEIAMLHGQPRDGKTWVSLEFAVAVALGASAFGLPSLTPAQAGAVLIIGNEDAEGAYVDRLGQMCRGRGIEPSTLAHLHFMVRLGVSLDDATWQVRIIAEAKRLAVALIVIDPLRSITARTDQGPAEFQPVALYLRRLLSETGAAIVLVHHDQKPQPGIVDTRRRAQRASGGGIFSNVDAPIHVVGGGDGRTLLTPEGFKHALDPAPLVIVRQHDGDTVRLVAETTTAASVADVELHTRILAFLGHTPGVPGSKVAEGIRAKKAATLEALHVLRAAGKVEAFEKGRAVRWFVAGTVTAE
jgi:DnaB-like helicase N terminal domain/AAA domain